MIDKNKISIIPINKSHLSKLRLWKNQNKNYFFHKDLITKEDQTKWYKLFKSRKNDYMFVIINNNSLVGCKNWFKGHRSKINNVTRTTTKFNSIASICDL